VRAFRLWYDPFVSQPRVLFHIISSLRVGGAEQFVVNMLRFHNRSRYLPVCICSQSPLGTPLEAMVQQMGAPLYFLDGIATDMFTLEMATRQQVRNENALVAAMQLLVRQPLLRAQMGQAARQRAVERFDVRQTVRAYEARYEEILRRRRCG